MCHVTIPPNIDPAHAMATGKSAIEAVTAGPRRATTAGMGGTMFHGTKHNQKYKP
jgi:hypothetical protein